MRLTVLSRRGRAHRSGGYAARGGTRPVEPARRLDIGAACVPASTGEEVVGNFCDVFEGVSASSCVEVPGQFGSLCAFSRGSRRTPTLPLRVEAGAARARRCRRPRVRAHCGADHVLARRDRRPFPGRRTRPCLLPRRLTVRNERHQGAMPSKHHSCTHAFTARDARAQEAPPAARA